jgi:hypothetical protein
VLFKIVIFWDKDLLQPTNLSATLANNADEISVGVKLAFHPSEFVRPHFLSTSGYSLLFLPRWSSADPPISHLPLFDALPSTLETFQSRSGRLLDSVVDSEAG